MKTSGYYESNRDWLIRTSISNTYLFKITEKIKLNNYACLLGLAVVVSLGSITFGAYNICFEDDSKEDSWSTLYGNYQFDIGAANNIVKL